MRPKTRVNPILLIVHWPGPPKITFQYHSGEAMLPYILENYNYFNLRLCMIAVLN